MFDKIRHIFRKRKIGKFVSNVPTGLLKMSEISTVNVVMDVEEPGFDQLREDILAWGRTAGVKLSIYFFDFRKLDKTELLITSIQTTIIKKELDWIGTPEISKVIGLIGEKSDLFISMIDNGEFVKLYFWHRVHTASRFNGHEWRPRNKNRMPCILNFL